MATDWSALPAPEDDGAARHLAGMALPSIDLPATDGQAVDLSGLSGLTVVFAYPKTGRPDTPTPDGWDMIPGAKGCTPQSCAFRDLYQDLRSVGVDHLFGLSTQDSAWQQEAVSRLHLPYPLLSDADLVFANALNLPVFQPTGEVLHKRLTLILRDGVIEDVIYPVFPPDENARDVVARLSKG